MSSVWRTKAVDENPWEFAGGRSRVELDIHYVDDRSFGREEESSQAPLG